LHRDIKPENVMLCRDPSSPEREVVKVLDFGIAKILDQTDSVSLPDEAPTGFRSVLTRVGGWVGTPGYMSPEQGSAEKLDHRSDLYSAGCLLYELVMRLLAKKPQDRPSTARDVADELLLLLGELEAPSSQRWQYYDSNSLAYAAAPPEPAPRPSVPPPSREAPKSAAGVDSTLRSAVEDQANLRQLRRTLHMDVPRRRSRRRRGPLRRGPYTRSSGESSAAAFRSARSCVRAASRRSSRGSRTKSRST
jgi:serine/threonine protein kinase